MTKGNNGTGNIPERDEWQTPQLLFDKLNKQYNFGVDCCATEENKKCNFYCVDFMVDYDFISLSDVCWMNPPFSKANEMFKHFFLVVNKGVCIYRCDNMETKVWQDIILKHATWIFIPKGRIAYEGMKGTGSRFPSALIGYNVEEPKGLEGFTLKVREKVEK